MSCVIVVGSQWGDEGKGKVVDLLTQQADVVVRFQGGNNAGHTLVVNGNQFILHLIPSGILHPGKRCLIGNGVVVDLEVLHKEVIGLRERGLTLGPENLAISEKAHLILPYHKHLDAARESAKGSGSIGTTGRGIGPCYEDKVARVGIRVSDILDEQVFSDKVRENLKEKNFLFEHYLKVSTLDPQEICKSFLPLADFIRPYVANVSLLIDEAFKNKRSEFYSREPRARIWISTTERILMSPHPTRWPEASAPVPVWGRTKSRRSWESLRPIPPGWAGDPSRRNCQTKPVSSLEKKAGNTGPLPGGPDGAAGWMPWFFEIRPG